MGLLSRITTVATPARGRADESFQKLYKDFVPAEWMSMLSGAGITVTPELAMTLSAMYCGVTTIAYDLATLPLQTFRYRDDEGKDRVRPSAGSLEAGGIGALAYRLRWQPNDYQTSTEYHVSLVAQFLLRGRAYAEIVPGASGFADQLLPRHPDRVQQERLPSGRLRYRLTEVGGKPRYVTQDEMHVVRDLSLDGLNPTSRIQFGANAIGSALAAERSAAKFFKSGMTSALVATYKGEKDDEDEDQLHKSITRYATGVENSFGLMLIPDDVTITNLGVEPEKAQMMLAREWGVREIARLLRLPGHKLGIKDSVGYNSQVQSALDYVVSCLRPIAVLFEQSIQRDLILAKDTFFAEFLLQALLRGDPESQANYIEKLIQNRVMWPSEARLVLNLNPDPRLDKLSEGDRRPGSSSKNGDEAAGGAQRAAGAGGRRELRAMLAMHDNAVRCVRRERLAVEKLARKHADDPAGWQAALRDFYSEHAGFLAQTMRLPMGIARGYAAQHGSEFEAKGVAIIDGEAGTQWEREEAEDLAALAIEDTAAAA